MNSNDFLRELGKWIFPVLEKNVCVESITQTLINALRTH